MGLPIRSVLQFVVVAEELSFTRAAARLGVAQPWLSARIQALEKQAGLRLFIRNTRKVELTDEGRILLEAAGPLAAAADAIERLLPPLRRSLEGTLKLGTPPYGMNVPERVALVRSFALAEPDISVDLDVGWTPVLIERLEAGELDAAFITGPFADDRFDEFTLCDTEMELLMNADDPLAGLDSVPLDALANRVVTAFTRSVNPPLYDYLIAPLAARGITIVQNPEPQDLLRGLRPGENEVIATQLGWSAREGAKVPGVVRRPLTPPTRRVSLHVVRRKGPTTPLLNRFWHQALALRNAR
ncbi:MAG TPA: LysR family transcriptional regulator [Stellaceae bacterium]|nr:LysR family transcriptional regulator [Stellaceae bacterium]